MFYVHIIFILNFDLLGIEYKVIFFLQKQQLYVTLHKNKINHISLIKEINTPYLHPYLSMFHRMEVKSYTV